MATSGFNGFPRQTFAFLRGLAANNNKDWLEAHRDDFEAYWMTPARACVEALGPQLKKVAPGIQYEPKVNGSIFRINRDVRFARDKSPYKTTLDLWFWHGSRSGWAAPGFFVRITADSAGMGAGMHIFGKPELDRYRKAVLDPGAGKALEKAIASVRAAGYEVEGATRKAIPRGYDAGQERAHLLLHEGLSTEFRGKPAIAQSTGFVDECARRAAEMWPIGKWLLAEVVAPT
jgi:uncharacterized protein (TIGR02453 family)